MSGGRGPQGGRAVPEGANVAYAPELFATRGVPDHVRSDNGSGFTANAVREWLARVGAKTLYIEPGSPWENGYCESLNGKLRDELRGARAPLAAAGRRNRDWTIIGTGSDFGGRSRPSAARR